MRNKGILAVLALAAAWALSLPAMAQKSESAPYVGLAFGQSTSDTFCENVGPPCKDQDQTWKVLGGYQYNRYLAIEAAYQSLGAPHDVSVPRDQKGQAMELVGILSYPVIWDLSIYGKLGAYHGRIKGSNAGASFNESNTDVTYGVGVEWNFFDPVAIRGEVQRYPRMGGGNAGSPQDIMVWSVGALFRFR